MGPDSGRIFDGTSTWTTQVLCSVFIAARSGPLIPLLVYFNAWNAAICFFFPVLVLPSTGWNPNCPRVLQTWGCWQIGNAISPFTPLLGFGLTEQGDHKPAHHWQVWRWSHLGQGIQIWVPEWLYVCCETLNTLPECCQLGLHEELYLFLKGYILLCSEESNLQLVGARFGKWGCLGWVRGSGWNRSLVASLKNESCWGHCKLMSLLNVTFYSSLAFGTLSGTLG